MCRWQFGDKVAAVRKQRHAEVEEGCELGGVLALVVDDERAVLRRRASRTKTVPAAPASFRSDWDEVVPPEAPRADTSIVGGRDPPPVMLTETRPPAPPPPR